MLHCTILRIADLRETGTTDTPWHLPHQLDHIHAEHADEVVALAVLMVMEAEDQRFANGVEGLQTCEDEPR